MNSKKIYSLLAIAIVILIFFVVIDNYTKLPESVPASDNSLKSWVEYHNVEFGYTISLPSTMILNTSKSNSVSAFLSDDMPSQGFYVEATTTSFSIENVMKTEQGNEVSWRWIIEKETQISGFHAIIAHKEYFNEQKPVQNDFSSRVVFVKKDNVILKFDLIGSGDDIFNTQQFVDNIEISI